MNELMVTLSDAGCVAFALNAVLLVTTGVAMLLADQFEFLGTQLSKNADPGAASRTSLTYSIAGFRII